jgi:hypothetical protein
VASVNDYGGAGDPLATPALGGPEGWAAAVAAALDQRDDTVDARIAALQAELDALKADVSYVDAQDALKADISYVDTQDALKADRTYVDTQDALKADKTYVDARDATKADKTYVDYMLGGGLRLVAGTAVWSGGSPLAFNIAGLSHVSAFHALNGDTGANSGQVIAFTPGAPATIWHTFNGGAFRVYYIAVGTGN